MELLVSPLLWPGSTPHMLNIIRKALLNLLTLADEPIAFSEIEYEEVPLKRGGQVFPLLGVYGRSNATVSYTLSGRNYGTSIVVAHINPVIQYLADTVESSVKKFNAINLDLLSKYGVLPLLFRYCPFMSCKIIPSKAVCLHPRWRSGSKNGVDYSGPSGEEDAERSDSQEVARCHRMPDE